MKKFTLLVMLLTASLSFAQLKKVEDKKSIFTTEIGKIQPLAQDAHMICKTNDEKNIYAFTFRDTEYKQLTQYQSFILTETGNDFDSLYQMIIDGIEAKKENSIKLELKDNIVWLNFVKSFGMTLVTFSSIEGKDETGHKATSNMFNKKQIEKLFGKKKK